MVEARRKVDAQGGMNHGTAEEMTPERAEYWEAISGLTDRQAITDEQMAFRRKIQSDMADVAPEERQAAE